MSVYFLAQIKITDEKEYQKYLDTCDDVFAKYKGEYLAADASPDILEGSWNYTRSVIIEFPNKMDFYAWYESDEYQEILKSRLMGSNSDAILVQGKKEK